ncbi:MAG: hypothetical protein IT454_04990 [Planctomycetes bacterium]|nr:hypothetical protein [Planctomycetota bacterium]
MQTTNTRYPILVPTLALALAAAAPPAVAQVSGVITRASLSSTGVDANGASVTNSATPLSISSDGRFVAFNSAATNLVSVDTNGIPDVFVRDLLLGTTERVSVTSSGGQAIGDSSARGSYGTALNADGRYVAFYSYSPNLVSGDTGGFCDVFVHDCATGATERVSVSTSNGSPNNASQYPSISSDGRYVVFQSGATNLVSGDKNNNVDVFLRDRSTNVTKRVSVSTAGKDANGLSSLGLGNTAVSADGRYVVFHSSATNLVSGDTNGQYDVFLRDLVANTTQRISLTSTAAQTNGWNGQASISADARYVAFYSYAPNLVPGGATVPQPQVYVRDRVLGTTACASVSSSGVVSDRAAVVHPAISGDGRFVTFVSNATNLVAGGTTPGYHVFVRDLALGTTTCPTASAAPGTTLIDVAIDSLGLHIAFDSLATNLVPGDTNGVQDVFVIE